MDDLMRQVKEHEVKLMVQQGMTEIILGFISSKFGKEDYIDFLKLVASSDKHSKEAKFVAAEALRQESLWPDGQISRKKQ